MPLSDPLGIENQDPLGIEKPSTPTLDISKVGTDPYDQLKLQELKGGGGPDSSFEQWMTPERQQYYNELLRKELEPSLRPLTPWEKFKSSATDLEHKLLPGTRPTGQPSPGKVIGGASMLLPIGLPEGLLSKGALGYFGYQTAKAQPDVVRSIASDIQAGDWKSAARTGTEDLLNLAMVGGAAAGHLPGRAPTEIQGPPSLGRYLKPPSGAEPTLNVESVQPLDVQSGSPISPQELIARQSRAPVLPETPEPEIKTWNLDQPEEIQNAPQSRQKPESNQPEHTGDAGERTPAQTGSGGGVESSAPQPAQANEPIARAGDARGEPDKEAPKVGDQIPKAERDTEGFADTAAKNVVNHLSNLPVGTQVKKFGNIWEKKSDGTWSHRNDIQEPGNATEDQGTTDGGRLEGGRITRVGNGESPKVTLDSVSKLSPTDYFNTAEGWAKSAMADTTKKTPGVQRMAEQAATQNPDLEAWQKAYDQANADAKRIRDEVAKDPSKMMERQKEMMGSGQKAQFFNEGIKAIKKLQAENPSMVGMGAAKYGEVTGPKTPLGELEQQIHILSEQSPVADKQKEAFNLGERLQTFKDGVSENLQGLKAAGKYLQKKLIGKPEVTDLKRAIGNRHLSLTDSAINARKFVETAEKKIPSKLIQEAISDYVDTGGDKALLEKAANETKRPYYMGYKRAQNLTPDEITVANNIRQYFESRLDDAQKNGILEDGIEDYIHRYYQSDTPWKNGILAELRSGIFTGKPALAKQRVFDYDFEAEKAGLKPIKSFIKRVAAYDLSLNKAIADRNIVKEMTQIKMPDGRPMVDVAGAGIPTGQPVEGEGATLIKPSARANSDKPIDNRSDYRPFDAPALRRWKWVGTDENGNPIMLQGDVLVHPDAIKDVRALFERSRVRSNPLGRLALNASSLVKQTMLDLSLFHPVQIAVHGLEHRSNVPFGELDAKFLGREFRPLDDYINDPQVRGLVRGGMVMGETTGRELFYEGLSGSSLTKHIPGVGPKLAQFTDWLFNDYIPRLKAETGLHALERNKKRYPNLSEDQLNHLTANQMNAAFGEQNYEMIGRSKTTQDMLRLAFLAPDFLESRMKFAGQATTKYGREQFAALMLGAATMYIVARLLNKAINNEYHFEPQNAFSVIRNGKAYSLRTVQGDILMAATDPEKFVRHRLNPVYGRTAMEAITQRDEFGRTRDARQQLQDFAQTIVPISLRGLINPREQNLLESTLNAVGVTEHRASPTTLVYNLANQYKKEHKIAQEPGEFIYDPDKDPYRPIRQAAIFSTPETVAAEIERAVKEGKKPEDILKHFQRYANAPFVGSKKKEAQFFQSLDADNQKIYRDAKLEKKKVLENVNMGIALWRRSKFNPQ